MCVCVCVGGGEEEGGYSLLLLVDTITCSSFTDFVTPAGLQATWDFVQIPPQKTQPKGLI